MTTWTCPSERELGRSVFQAEAAGGYSELPDDSSDQVVRVDLRDLENGDVSQNVRLRNNDTVFVLRAESVYVFGQVNNPGAYPLRQKDTTVLQALSLAGGVTGRWQPVATQVPGGVGRRGSGRLGREKYQGGSRRACPQAEDFAVPLARLRTPPGTPAERRHEPGWATAGLSR